jgi:hypothetical protein
MPTAEANAVVASLTSNEACLLALPSAPMVSERHFQSGVYARGAAHCKKCLAQAHLLQVSVVRERLCPFKRAFVADLKK